MRENAKLHLYKAKQDEMTSINLKPTLYSDARRDAADATPHFRLD